MSKNIKKPKVNPKTGKISPPAETISKMNTDRLPPIFSLTEMQDGIFDLTLCQNKEKCSLIDTIRLLSKHTWQQLKSSPRHGIGYEKIEFGAIIGQNTLKKKKEIENQGYKLIAFRFHDKAPIVGYRDGRIFHLVWIDRDFSLYNHG